MSTKPKSTKKKTTADSLAEKILSTDSMPLTKAESDELRIRVSQILERNSLLESRLSGLCDWIMAMTSAMKRQGIQLTSFNDSDGSTVYDLENSTSPVPVLPTVPETVN